MSQEGPPQMLVENNHGWMREWHPRMLERDRHIRKQGRLRLDPRTHAETFPPHPHLSPKKAAQMSWKGPRMTEEDWLHRNQEKLRLESHNTHAEVFPSPFPKMAAPGQMG